MKLHVPINILLMYSFIVYRLNRKIPVLISWDREISCISVLLQSSPMLTSDDEMKQF